MDLSHEQENFVKISLAVLDVVPKHLRDLFKSKWDLKFPNNIWNDSKICGQFLFNNIPAGMKKKGAKFTEPMQTSVESGITSDWDQTVLFFIFLNAGLKLIDGARPVNARIAPYRISEELESLRNVRNTCFAHAKSSACPTGVFQTQMTEMKRVALSIFGQVAVNEIDTIENACIGTTLSVNHKKQLDKEMKLNAEYNQWQAKFEQDLKDLKEDVTEIKADVSGISKNQSETKETISKMEANIEGLSASHSDLKEDVAEIKADVGGISKDQSETKETISKMEANIEGLSASHSDLKEDVVEIKADVGGISKDQSEAKDTMSKMEANIEGLSASHSDFKEDVAEIKADVGEISKNQSETKETMSKMEANIEGLSASHSELKDNVGTLSNRQSAIENRLGNIEQDQKPQKPKEERIRQLKEYYQRSYGKHEMHSFDDGNLVVKRFEIKHLSVKTKVVHNIKGSKGYAGEMARFREALDSGVELKIDNLIGEEERVSFVRGVAGIGKSVLTKQIVNGWATGEMYEKFTWCIMVECRDLNDFRAKEGKQFEKHQIFDEFMKARFGEYGVDGGDDVLFLVDGLDELFDINTDDSIIYDLLDSKKGKYKTSRIIMTGRPHVQHFVERQDIEIGGSRVLEIMGLAQKEVDAYIDKSARCISEEQTGINEEQTAKKIETINKVKEKSQNIRWLVSIPQFLNTLCCIALFTGGTENIRNVSQLYAWTLALLLDQHLNSKGAVVKKKVNIKQVFQNNLKAIKALSEITYELLMKNEIIIDEESYERIIERLDIRTEQEKKFLEGLFVDVSTNYENKYQFKHLSLMEFLTALHCCTLENISHVIGILLEKKLFQVVHFVCGILGTLRDKKDLLAILVKTIKPNYENSNIIKDLIEAMTKCTLDKKEKFFSIVQCALECGYDESKITYSLEFIASLGETDLDLSKAESDRLTEFIYVVGKDWSTDSMRKAFSSVNIQDIIVNNFALKDYLYCFGRVEIVNFEDMIIMDEHFNDLCTFLSTVRCRVNITRCKFDLKLDEKPHRISHSKLELLVIDKCELNINLIKRFLGFVEYIVIIRNTTLTSSSEGDASHDDANATNADVLDIDNVTFNGNAFADLCVAIFPLVRRVALRNMKELDYNEMIRKLEEMYRQRKMGKLEELSIGACGIMTQDQIDRILQCGVKLKIDGVWILSDFEESNSGHLSDTNALRGAEQIDLQANLTRNLENQSEEIHSEEEKLASFARSSAGIISTLSQPNKLAASKSYTSRSSLGQTSSLQRPKKRSAAEMDKAFSLLGESSSSPEPKKHAAEKGDKFWSSQFPSINVPSSGVSGTDQAARSSAGPISTSSQPTKPAAPKNDTAPSSAGAISTSSQPKKLAASKTDTILPPQSAFMNVPSSGVQGMYPPARSSAATISTSSQPGKPAAAKSDTARSSAGTISTSSQPKKLAAGKSYTARSSLDETSSLPRSKKRSAAEMDKGHPDMTDTTSSDSSD